MELKDLSIILFILLVIIIFYILSKKNNNESFGLSGPFGADYPIMSPTQAYLKYPRDDFQINQIYYPFYNQSNTEYIGKYPYYNYMFHPYSSSVYYT